MKARSVESGCIVADLMMPEMTGLSKGATSEKPTQQGAGEVKKGTFGQQVMLIEENTRKTSERLLREEVTQQFENLSRREGEVMKLLVTGLTLKSIAGELGISVQTASKHRLRLFEKLDIQNEVELVKLMMQIDPGLPLNGYSAA